MHCRSVESKSKTFDNIRTLSRHIQPPGLIGTNVATSCAACMVCLPATVARQESTEEQRDGFTIEQ